MSKIVTILVLVEYSLQLDMLKNLENGDIRHNPCFSRILFAILSLTDDNVVEIVSQSLF